MNGILVAHTTETHGQPARTTREHIRVQPHVSTQPPTRDHEQSGHDYFVSHAGQTGALASEKGCCLVSTATEAQHSSQHIVGEQQQQQQQTHGWSSSCTIL